MTVVNRERPSRHGAILGDALAAMAEAGRPLVATIDPCLTCAFRPDSMTNQMAATGLQALHCTLGSDPSPFGCHHGMKDGEPTRLCAGYVAARAAPWDQVQAIMAGVGDRLGSMAGPDMVRAAFDAWRAGIDPPEAMDDYQLAREWAKRGPT